MSDRVLTGWYAPEVPTDAARTAVSVTARPAGLVAFVLNLMNLAQEERFTVTGDAVSLSTTTITGHHELTVPLSEVTSTGFGYRRPIKAAAACLVSGVASLASIGDSGGAGVIFALALLGLGLALLLRRRLELNFSASGIGQHHFAFRNSVVEGQRIDFEHVAHAGNLVRAAHRAATSRGGQLSGGQVVGGQVVGGQVAAQFAGVAPVAATSPVVPAPPSPANGFAHLPAPPAAAVPGPRDPRRPF